MFEPHGNTDNVVFLAPRFCPNRCGATILSKDYFTESLGHDCPLAKRLCPHGCGDIVLGQDMPEHRASLCGMMRHRDRGDRAVQEKALKELRLAIAGCYEERDRAQARFRARGEAAALRAKNYSGFTHADCAGHVAQLEAACREIQTRARRKAKDQLEDVLAVGDASAPKTKSALSLWAGIEGASLSSTRAARPWDSEQPNLEPLLQAVAYAQMCGDNFAIRRTAESTLMAMLCRGIEAHRLNVEPEPLLEAADAATSALSLIELEDTFDLQQLIESARDQYRNMRIARLDSHPDFHDAVERGDVAMARMLLEHEKASPSTPNPKNGMPPVVVAARAGDLAMCRLLIARQADLERRVAADGMTALHWAAHSRLARVQSLLLASGANPRIQDKRGHDALMKLVRRDLEEPAAGCAVIWHAAPGRSLTGPVLAGRHLSLEEAQAAAEVDPGCVGFCSLELDGDTYVELRGVGAAQGGPPACQECDDADTLAGPFDDIDSRLWRTHLKVEADAVHDAREMLAMGADVNARDLKGCTPLHHHLQSSPSNGSPAVVELLLRASADVNLADSTARGTTPLLQAVLARRADLVELMLRQAFPPADVDARSADGCSALQLAEERGASKVARLLREAGATAWADAQCQIGHSTAFLFDTRQVQVASVMPEEVVF